MVFSWEFFREISRFQDLVTMFSVHFSVNSRRGNLPRKLLTIFVRPWSRLPYANSKRILLRCVHTEFERKRKLLLSVIMNMPLHRNKKWAFSNSNCLPSKMSEITTFFLLSSGGSRISQSWGQQPWGGEVEDVNIRFCQVFPKTAWNWKSWGGHVSLMA